MLNLSYTVPERLVEKKIATVDTWDATLGTALGVIASEGIPLVGTIEDNVQAVQPCYVGADLTFVGFSFAHNLVPTIASKVEEVTVPSAAPYTTQLSRTALVAGQISVFNAAGTIQTEVPGAPATTQYNCVDLTGILTFNVAQAGATMTVGYRYSPTTLEVKYDFPHESVNIQPAFEYLDTVGVIMEGEVYTDQFDAATDWANTTAIYLDDGILTHVTTTRTLITAVAGAKVIHVPEVDNPFLGIRFVA